MNISVIVIGDELLIGQVTDTNSGFIARTVAPEGWEVKSVLEVGDNEPDILRAIDEAFALTDVVITTGGLGPTKDDITKPLLCRYFGGTLVRDPEVTANIRRIFEGRGLQLNTLTADQALVPTSCRVIQNLCGTAPIMWFERPDGEVLVAMPGVPFETETMFVSEVFPQLRERFRSRTHVAHAVVMVTGFTESALAMKLEPWETALPAHLHLAYLPKQGVIRLRIDARHESAGAAQAEAERASAEIVGIIGKEHVIATQDLTPAEILLNMCRDRGIMLASAESCTGGNIAHTLTLIPGASDVVAGGVVSYSNEVKHNVLGVKNETLAAFGAVSVPVVREMTEGVARVTGAQLTMATSGIAGPGGGTPDKPVGTVCIAARLAIPGEEPREIADTFRFNGTRARIIDTSTTRAILLAISLLK